MMSSSPRKMFVLLCCFFLIENQKADHPHFRLTAFILIGDHATVGPWEHHGHERIHAGNRNGMVKPPELWLLSYTLASQVLFEQRGSQSELCYVPHNTVTANARGIFFFFFPLLHHIEKMKSCCGLLGKKQLFLVSFSVSLASICKAGYGRNRLKQIRLSMSHCL